MVSLNTSATGKQKMSAFKQRYQNPPISDTVRLEFFVLNSNNFAEVQTINSVAIYYLDPSLRSSSNPDGRTLIQTIPGSSVQNPNVGEYFIDLFLDPLLYTQTGRYIDEWSVVFVTGDAIALHDQLFQIFPQLWYTTPIPIVYDFSFYFQPNRMRFGEKKFIEIEIIPNVPRATDLFAYYQNLAISAQLFVNIRQKCGDCVPCESDLALVADRVPAQYREKNRGFYQIDTNQLDCGIYDIWFELDFGGNIYISDTNQFQVYG
jgi:hypothetical protein